MSKDTAQKKEACCVAAVREELMSQDSEITAIRFELSSIRRTAFKHSPKKTGQAITIYYTARKNKKGAMKQRRPEKTFISHDYCPFCGKKYE